MKKNSKATKFKKTLIPIIKINGEQKAQKKPERNAQISDQYLVRKNKTQKIAKKKINFEINYSNFQKQYKKYGNLFVHALSRLTCDKNFSEPDKGHPTSKNFPVQITNILYGQNINNYNPYIEALDKLYDSFRGKISKQKMQKIKKLCYIGIAKNFFKTQKYSQTPKYSRVNILIRTYMYENMRSIIEQKAQNYQNIVFIPCNKGSLSFSYQNFPEELRQICTQQSYRNTIENVNKIIENNYINYKKINTKNTVTDRWGQNLFYVLTFFVFLIFLASGNIVVIYILAFLILISVLLYVIECRQTLSMLGSSKNIISKIQLSLQNYLREINTHNMEWKVGEDFYWLQIHYIRKKKKKHVKNSH